MPNIVIISASIRIERASHRAALYFEKFINEHQIASVQILDLNVYQFPLFNERLKYQKNPSPAVLDFAEKIKNTDGVIIVTPEYNGGYPASLKNVVDLLYDEWYRKPISFVACSDGSFGGTQVVTSLLFTFWKIKAWVVPPMFPVPKVYEMFDELGNANDKATVDKRAKTFLNELTWSMQMKQAIIK